MPRHLPYLAVLLVLSACNSPTSPGGASGAQSLVDKAAPDLKINGVTVQPGSTTNAAVGTMIAYRIDYTNNSGQTLHYAILFVRDDGVERLDQCGATGSGGGGGGFGSGTTIFTNDPFFLRGHTVRMLLLYALGSGPQGPGQCFFQSSPGQVNHANVQAERLLMTLAVQ